MSGGDAKLPEMITNVAGQILARPRTGILRIAVDGVDGVGKTTFADHLGAAMHSHRRTVIRASIDGFHNPREHRYRLGKGSPEGFYRDSYDYAAFMRSLLKPLSPGGSRQYRTAVFDHRTDTAVDAPTQTAPEAALLIVDGIFLQRHELRRFWDIAIFLDAPFSITVPRGAARGPNFGSPDPHAASNQRYVEGQKLYFAEAAPIERADIVIDYSDLDAPVVVRTRPALRETYIGR